MSAVREGDLAKLGSLFDRYHLSLFDFLNRMTGNRHTAEDLVQEVFLRILKYRATYRLGSTLFVGVPGSLVGVSSPPTL